MIKPEDVHKILNPSMLEQEIDNEIICQSEQRIDTICVNVSILPSYYYKGWFELRPEYQKYWVLDERRLIDKSDGNDHLFVTFTPKPEKESMIGHVQFPDDK